jgi:hypothetical protein
MTRAGIDSDERSLRGIDLDARGRDDAHQEIVHGPCKGAPVEHQFSRIAEDVRNFFGEMLAILVSALAKNVEKQRAALCCIDHVLEYWREGALAQA